MQGLGEIPAIQQLFIDHARFMLKQQNGGHYEEKSQICKRKRRMKRVILMAIGSALLLPSQAQLQNKKYTNFNDSIFSINEVVVATNYRRKTDALKLDVPAKFIPISTNSITSEMLEKRNIRDIQEAARFLPGVRFRTSYSSLYAVLHPRVR